MKAAPQNIQFVCEGLDHPEGVAFDLNGDLYAGGEAGQIYCIDPAEGSFKCFAKTGGTILGVTLDGNGRVYACDIGRREVVQCSPDGQVTVYATGTDEQPLVNPNYSVFDAEGRLFFSDSGDYWNPGGSIWVAEPGKQVESLTPPNLPFANGMCLDSEEEYLYLVLSTSAKIVRFKLDGKNLAGKMEIVAELPNKTVPDGIALDTSRNIWLGYWAPDEIWKVSQNGTFEKIMVDWTGELLNRPTNIALKHNRVFFSNFGGWHIGSFETEVEPLPLNYPLL